MMLNKKLNDSPFFNVFTFSLFWALQIFVTKLGFIQGANSTTMVIQSAFVALIVLSFYVIPKYFNEIKMMSKQILIGLLIANILHFGLGGFLSNAGISLTSAVNAGFLVKFTLVVTTLLAWIFLKEKMTWTKAIAVLVMLFGNFLISTKGQSLVPQIGDVLIILACFCWSGANILIRNTLNKKTINADIISFLRPVAGIPVYFLFILLTPLYPISVQKMFAVNIADPTYFIYAIGGGISMAIMWIYLNRTLKVASASYMTMMSMMTSVFVTTFALVFLKETITLSQTVGAVLTIGAGIVTHYSGMAKG